MNAPPLHAEMYDRNRTHRRRLLLASIAVVASLVLAIVWAVRILHPMPPRTVTMTTGPEGGDYQEFGKRYREILGRSGVELRLLPSSGGVENLRRLLDPQSGADIGFVPGGIAGGEALPDLLSLGTVSYEPFWFFYRGPSPGRNLEGLRGKRISIGPEGSATRFIAEELLARFGFGTGFAGFLPHSPQVAAEELLAGRIEAALMLASWESPAVQRLLAADNVELASFARADAIVTLYPYLNKLVVPAGVADMGRNRPPADVVVLAPETGILVRRELHPAIQYLLLDAAEQIHSSPGVLRKAGQFPAAQPLYVPLSDPALHFYKSGRPFLQRYLPFWLAVLVAQSLVLLIPIAVALYPLVRVIPGVYGLGIRLRIFRLYGELKFLDLEAHRLPAAGDARDLYEQLDRLEDRASRLHVPVIYTHLLFELRRDIDLVRRRLEMSPGAARGQRPP
ncbi:MAG TPA: TAXI family TRAP transporter solute-binding subunit [Candidatus Deferrimicrobiaceae bacterium]